MSRAERAKEYFQQGYACSQAVALAFADLTGLDRATLGKLTLPFGGGLGRQRLVCGAVSGMVAIYGLMCAGEENTPTNKQRTYEITRKLCNAFKTENGSLICEELLTGANLKVEIGGVVEARTTEYYKKRPCAEIVYAAAKILEEYLGEIGEI